MKNLIDLRLEETSRPTTNSEQTWCDEFLKDVWSDRTRCHRQENRHAERITDREHSYFDGVSDRIIRGAKHEIDSHGRDPKETVQDALKDNRVILIGETHTSPNPSRYWGNEMVPEFKKAGVTHLAVEMDQDAQRFLTKNGKVNRPGLRLSGYRADNDFCDMIDAALAAGIKIVPVDKADAATRDPDRDQCMSNAIDGILTSDNNAKVVYWVGSTHAQKAHTRYDSTAQLLTESGKKHGYTVATFGITTDHPRLSTSTPYIFAESLRDPVSVKTADTKFLKNLPSSSLPQGDYYKWHSESKVGDWDYLVMFPHDYKLAKEQKRIGGKNPELVPLLDDLAESCADNLKPKLAVKYLEEALKIVGQDKDSKPEHLAKRHDQLGQLYEQQGSLNAAQKHLEAALTQEQKAATSVESLTVAERTISLAKFHQRKGGSSDAESLFKKAVEINRKLLDDLERNKPEESSYREQRLSLHRQLVDCYLAADQPVKAEKAHREALAFVVQAHGADSATAAELHGQVGNTAMRAGNYSRAEKDYQTQIAILEKRKDSDREIASGLADLAACYLKQRKPELAQPLLERELKILAKDEARPARKISAGRALAQACSAQGDAQGAASAYEDAAKIAEGEYASAEIADLYGEYAQVLTRLGKTAEAGQWQSRSSRISQWIKRFP